MNLNQQQQEARDTVHVRFDHCAPGLPRPYRIGTGVNLKLDAGLWLLHTKTQARCNHLRLKPVVQDFRTQKSDVLTFTAVLFDRSDCRNIYAKLDWQHDFRTATLRDLFSTAELTEATQTGKRLVILVRIGWIWDSAARWHSVLEEFQPSVQFWTPDAHNPREDRREEPEEVPPRQASHPDISATAVLHIKIPPKGPCQVSYHGIGEQAKVDSDQHMSLLYGRWGLPKLTFQKDTPLPGVGLSDPKTPLHLAVRLINQLQLMGLDQVTLPAHVRIDLASCEVTATRIKTAIRYALDQTKQRFDHGKAKDDLTRTKRLFESGSSNDWKVELWVLPQGHDVMTFHAYEGTSLANFCMPGWEGHGLYMEAHIVPADIHYTLQSEVPAPPKTVDQEESEGSESSDASAEIDANTVDLYGYDGDATGVENFRYQQRLGPARLDWPTTYFEYFLYVDLIPSSGRSETADGESGTTSSMQRATLQAILNKRHTVDDYDNRETQHLTVADGSHSSTDVPDIIYYLGINVINSLHALSLDDVQIPPILMRTSQPASLTTSSVFRRIFDALESPAGLTQEAEDALSRLFHNEIKQKWRLQLWYLPQGEGSTVMYVPREISWNQLLVESDHTLYLEAHAIPVVRDEDEQTISTPEKKIDKGKGRATVADLMEDEDELDADDGLSGATGGNDMDGWSSFEKKIDKSKGRALDVDVTRGEDGANADQESAGNGGWTDNSYVAQWPQDDARSNPEDVDGLSNALGTANLSDSQQEMNHPDFQRAIEKSLQDQHPQNNSQRPSPSPRILDLPEGSAAAERRRLREDREANNVIDEALEQNVDETLGANFYQDGEEEGNWDEE
ncbi:hypothetical protein CLAFUW4_02402 [Fulvia fulva]|uniref:Uncharacterized protein n=1 Tax=Passalora fulva TaxID=5499 RepID=A0A9Q8L9I6_PASFU|nr:uncharacterized protein CLAFUR5_02390 [Fulvia fulva]KAK4631997.1 hypothetical protein CLAFUR4_02397 [Fulvia fulva]KAK4633955.1 hypothetical protein CLAFUR0_02401 [Fulvia fulva]UJO13194.1 hypothetical protein CLAFUR5_02390 [Fulvia fulva]WPV11542.1 hypothetical protein CLAFUW4_02402 [Fulvia fulva]WPV26409.1 hypothetical protein CLAFUW7_02402 [Fulvia fulva]